VYAYEWGHSMCGCGMPGALPAPAPQPAIQIWRVTRVRLGLSRPVCAVTNAMCARPGRRIAATVKHKSFYSSGCGCRKLATSSSTLSTHDDLTYIVQLRRRWGAQ